MGVALRHKKDVKEVLKENVRVVKPGGAVIIADYSIPTGGMAGLVYRFYFFRIMPLLGWLLSFKRDIYALLKYLPCSIQNFHPPERIAEAMQEAGLNEVEVVKLGQGAICIYTGLKT